MEEQEISPERLALLRKLEHLMSWCCNDFIQNYGPGGSYEGSGRIFDYPARFNKNGEELKVGWLDDEDFQNEKIIMSGVYKFGANQMPVYRNLNDVLKYLETNFGLKIPK